MIDMTEGEAEYLKYRFKQYLGSVSRAIQNKRLEEQKMEMASNTDLPSVTLQEPTTKNDLGVDCISRQEVLRLLANSIGKSNTHLQTKVLKMSSVPPQEPRWIPVSERLPENKETVLVTFKHFVSGNTIGLGSVILLQDKPHWHVREQNLGTYDVLAWKPLPKPYESQESEK